MNNQNKNIIKLIISFLVIITIVVCGIILIVKTINKEPEQEQIIEQHYSENDLKNNENSILNKTINEENNTTEYTPIKEEIIEEGLIEEEIIDKPLLEENIEIKDPILPTTEKNSYLNNYETAFYVEGDYINVWDIDFYVEPQKNKKTNENSMLLMRQTFEYETDANELKEKIMTLINNFVTDNSNVVFKRNTHIKNLYDIPEYGLRILSEDDENFNYLHISSPNDNYKYINVEYTIVSKIIEQVKSKDQKLPMILSDFENMLSFSTSSFEFKKSVEDSSGHYTDLKYENQNKGEEAAAFSSMYAIGEDNSTIEESEELEESVETIETETEITTIEEKIEE